MVSNTIACEEARICMYEIGKTGLERFKKYDIKFGQARIKGIPACIGHGWIKHSPKFSCYDYEVTKKGRRYINAGYADMTTELPIQFMVNAVHTPVNNEGMVGDYRKDLYVGLRIPGKITVESKEMQAIEAALDAGCNIELWAEKITE